MPIACDHCRGRLEDAFNFRLAALADPESRDLVFHGNLGDQLGRGGAGVSEIAAQS